MANDIKFISYDGSYPNLCSGTLVIEVFGVKFELQNVLVSGGHVWFDDNYDEHVETGSWELSYDFPEELEPFRKEIRDLVNENVPYGCCGGCV